MSAHDGGRLDGAWGGRGPHHHLWPHGTRVIDLGDDVHVAAHLRDFAAHDYDLRGVRVLGVGAVHVVAYYDGRLQSGLTQKQRDLVRGWVRRHAAATGAAVPTAPVRAPVWAPAPAARAVANAVGAAGRGAARERTRWLLVGLLAAAVGWCSSRTPSPSTGPRRAAARSSCPRRRSSPWSRPSSPGGTPAPDVAAPPPVRRAAA